MPWGDLRFRKIYPAFWRDDRVCGLLEAKQHSHVLAILYVLTGPQSNRIGFYNFSIGEAAEDFGTSTETFARTFAEVLEVMGWEYDKRRRVILIPSWWEWNVPINPNVLVGNLKDLNEVSESPLFAAFAACEEALPKTLQQTFAQTLRDQYAERMGKRYPQQEQEQEQEQEEKSARISSENSYITKKGRKLSGDKLAFFERFWEAFDYKEGKTQAADSWWEIKGFTAELAETIIAAAEEEAKRRPSLVTNGRTPKMAQGWLSARRWEDERTPVSKRGALGNERKGGVHRELFQDGGDGGDGAED